MSRKDGEEIKRTENDDKNGGPGRMGIVKEYYREALEFENYFNLRLQRLIPFLHHLKKIYGTVDIS